METVTEAKLLLQNLVYDGTKKITVCSCGPTQIQKNTPSLK